MNTLKNYWLYGLAVIIIIFVGVIYFNKSSEAPALSPETGQEATTTPTVGAPAGTPPAATLPTTPAPTMAPSAKGERVVFAITDKAAPLPGIKSALLNIERLWVYHERLGWQEITLKSKVFDLLALRQGGVLKLLSDARLPSGTYTQVQMRLGAAAIIPFSGETQSAKLQAADVKFDGRFMVKEKDTALVVWDFLLDRALHITKDSKYIFLPVVELRGQTDVFVEVTSEEKVSAGGGGSVLRAKVGVDENGVTKQEYELNPNVGISVLSSGALLILNPGESDEGLSITAERAVSLATSPGALTEARSVRIKSEGSKKYWLVYGVKAGAITSVKIDAETGESVL